MLSIRNIKLKSKRSLNQFKNYWITGFFCIPSHWYKYKLRPRFETSQFALLQQQLANVQKIFLQYFRLPAWNIQAGRIFQASWNVLPKIFYKSWIGALVSLAELNISEYFLVFDYFQPDLDLADQGLDLAGITFHHL